MRILSKSARALSTLPPLPKAAIAIAHPEASASIPFLLLISNKISATSASPLPHALSAELKIFLEGEISSDFMSSRSLMASRHS